MLTEEDKADRFNLRNLFDKRQSNEATKAGFFYFENQEFMIAQGKETYVVVSGDMAVGYPLFMQGESDFSKFVDAVSLLRDSKGKNCDVLWDIGANIGSICIPAVARNLVKSAVAFEPASQLFKLLRANTILNGVDERIQCHNTALGNSRGSVDLTMPQGNTGDYRIAGLLLEDDAMGEASRIKQSVEIRPLDDFEKSFDENSTFIFMDVQGYEGLILRGAEKILSKSPPLVAEFWPYAMKRLETYTIFRDVVCSGIYSEFAVLSDNDKRFISLSAQALDSLYDRIGEHHDSFTDLLFV
ncbi:FkbM family methyltransferase [Agrobacterium tumefaciens]